MALTDSQLEERLSGIGGSDAPVVLGLSPFKDPLTLYLEKRRELPVVERRPVGEEDGRYWGSLLEGPICQAYERRMQKTNPRIRVVRDNQFYRSKRHEFMVAHVDRRVLNAGKRLWLEAKSDAFGHGWGDEGTNEIPPYIMVQVQHYIEVLGADQIDLAVLIGNRTLRVFSIIRLDHIIEQIILAEEQFWDRVVHGIPPEPDWRAPSVTKLLKELYPGTDGSVVQLPGFAQEIHDTRQQALARRKEADSVIIECDNRMRYLLGEAAAGILPDGTCYTRKKVERSGYTVEPTEYVQMRWVKKAPKLVTDALEKNEVIVLPDKEQHGNEANEENREKESAAEEKAVAGS